jgi:RNA polymerase sigma factor (sigma-70 family)
MDWRTGAVLRHLRQLTAEHDAENLSDHDLVDRFAAAGDEAAFEALVRRHGPMVWRVCLDVVKHVQDAEDAFQATFLVLARRAPAIRKRASVASWLHGVAHRVALQARGAARRRSVPENGDVAMTQADPLNEMSRREQQGLLHDELSRLAEKYRAPLVLCYLEGKTQDEAARQLGWSKRTFCRRLDQARGLLQARLHRRGFALAAVWGGASLAHPAQGALLPAALLWATVRAARAFATRSTVMGGASAEAAALAEGVLRAIAIAQLKAGAVLAAVCGVLLAGTGVVAHQIWVARNPDPAPVSYPAAVRTALTPDLAPRERERLDAVGDLLPEGAQTRLGTTRLRIGATALCFAFAPDGKTVAASGAGCIRFWAVATGKTVLSLEAPGKSVWAIAFAPDGKTLAAAGLKGRICLWDLGTGLPLREFGESEQEPFGLVFSPDGRTLASGSRDGTVHLWKVQTGEECGRFRVQAAEGAAAGMWPIAFFPDSRTVATQDVDWRIRLWDTVTGRELRWLNWLPRPLEAVALAPDGTVVAAAARDQSTVRLWQVASGQELRALHGHRAPVEALAFSPDGSTLASGSRDGTLRLWQVASGAEVAQVRTAERGSNGLAFSPDGGFLASGFESTIRLWETATGAERHRFEGHRDGVVAVTFSDTHRLVSAGLGGTAIRWDADTGRLLSTRTRAQLLPEYAAAFSPDGRWLASGNTGGVIRVSDLVSGQEIGRWQGHQGMIWRLTFAPNGQTLLSGSQDQSLALWEPLTGREVARLAGYPSPVLAADFSPDGRLVACGRQDGTIGLWEVATGKPRPRWRGAPCPVRALAFSPDGKTLASVQDPVQGRGAVCLWEIATGRTRWQTSVADTKAQSLTFSPDGRTLAMGGSRLIQRWDLATGQELRPLAGHLGPVLCLAFSPDGARLASGSKDATALIWKQTPLPPLPAPRKEGRAPHELEALWNDLANADAESAYRAVWDLTGAAERALPLLEARLRPASLAMGPPERATIPVEPLTAGAPPPWLGPLRALEVLERIGTPAAYRLLQALATDAAPTQVAEEARSALRRRATVP